MARGLARHISSYASSNGRHSFSREDEGGYGCIIFILICLGIFIWLLFFY